MTGWRAAAALVLLLCLVPFAGAVTCALADPPDASDDAFDAGLAWAGWGRVGWTGALALDPAHALVPACEPSRHSAPASSPRSLRSPPRF